ncbi:hypothetical protein Q7L59_24275 [Pseudomonas protegens]|nr:hypothetical protein [Pseudomonas protegens]
MNKAIETLPYYEPTAYSPSDIPDQPTPIEQSWLLRFSGGRLPWGNTQHVVPSRIMQDPKPSSMRFWEAAEKEKNKKKANGTYIPAIFEGVELHQKYDQERYRFAQLPFRSQFWLFMQGGGDGYS